MPSINMIASRRSEKRRFERNTRRLVALIVIQMILGVVLGGVFTLRIFGARARISDLDVQLQKLSPTVKRIKDCEVATAKLRPRLTLLKDAQHKTLKWRNLLTELSHSLPEQCWLTKLGTSSPPPGQTGDMTVSLNGVSINQNQVGEAMLRLNTYPDLKDVSLHYTQGSNVGKRKAIEFEIGAALKEEKAKEVAGNASGKS